MTSFKAERLGGDGSQRAVNALRAALAAGHFPKYHALLFARQARVEASGGFTTVALLKLADEVPGLRGTSSDSAVKTMKYRSFVTVSQKGVRRGQRPRAPGPRDPDGLHQRQPGPGRLGRLDLGLRPGTVR
ncbi:DsbA family protein [Streptomyces sp. NPDC050504]|uniref:DsbA family protein n=1 Tax=Streptomyces sp. NPDC050504 TaxID=3365618 RepID=UPI00379AD8E6